MRVWRERLRLHPQDVGRLRRPRNWVRHAPSSVACMLSWLASRRSCISAASGPFDADDKVVKEETKRRTTHNSKMNVSLTRTRRIVLESGPVMRGPSRCSGGPGSGSSGTSRSGSAKSSASSSSSAKRLQATQAIGVVSVIRSHAAGMLMRRHACCACLCCRYSTVAGSADMIIESLSCRKPQTQ